MAETPKWYRVEDLRKRWGIDWRQIELLLEEGLPAYYRDGDFVQKLNYEPQQELDFSELLFKPSDVEAFEQDNPWVLEQASEQIEKSFSSALTAKESRELGQLRSEKAKWDSSLKAAVRIGIFCAGQNDPLTRDQVADEIYQIDPQLPKTTFEQIWRAIPEQYRKAAGRPKKK